MTSSSADDPPTEPSDSYATRDRSPETIDYVDRLDSSLIEGVERDRADDVPVFLLPNRADFERALLSYEVIQPDSLQKVLQTFPESETPADSLGLARGLVKAGILTRYQASAVLQGKAKALALGPYLVLDRLGSGGMGLVFQARHRDSGDVVALKILPPSASKQEQAVLRFRREAKIMAQVAHANVVASREIGEHNGVHYLVMDYVEGLDLHRIVRSEGPLGVRRAVDCLIQAARGLVAAHERGIVHRDIKPANLMVEPGGTVRVLDLGLARITQAADPLQGRDPDPSLTQSGMIMGTVDFVSPEQSNNSKHADHRSDIYSLGCTLHYLLTARPPYVGETIMERLIAHHQQPTPSLLAARPDVPAGLDTLFHRMMEKDPTRRPQSMNEVIQALEVALAQGEVPASERWESLATGWVAADRAPVSGDLSGYEVLTEAQSNLLSPLLESSSEEVPLPVDRIPKKAAAPTAGSLVPSKHRRWIGLALLVLVAVGVGTILIAFMRSLFPARP